MLLPDSPLVINMAFCNMHDAEGNRCGAPTGMTASGVDADLCLEHRAVMDKQRKENRKLDKQREEDMKLHGK